jgi:hypothetical protein
MMAQGELLLLLAVHLVLTGLPGIAAALFAARSGEGRVPVLLAIGLAATGTAAMLAFWAYYADRQAGETCSWLLLLGSVLLAGWSLHGRRVPAALLRKLAVPLALWALGAVFIVFLGFLHSGLDTAIGTSATRFYVQLPSDNDIPFFYAGWYLENAHAGTPPEYPGEWLSSDRPPLQVGYVLAQSPFRWMTDERHYQLLGVVLQQLWIVGLWALLLAARIGRLTRALAMVAVLLSPLAIINGFYVWPKLLPAAMLLAAAALVLTPLWSEVRRSLWGAALIALLFGLALLGHGASAFGVAALALVAAFRGLPGWRWIGVAALVGFLIFAPWSAYQKYEDPPGNRLTKWMIDGSHDIDDRSSSEAIVGSYREAGLGGTVGNKWESFLTVTGGDPAIDLVGMVAGELGEADFREAVVQTRVLLFLYMLPSLGFLLVALPAMALGSRRVRGDPGDWSFALTCSLAFLVGVGVWILLLFGGEEAPPIVQHGSYLVPVLAICAAVAGLRATFPRLAIAMVAANVVLALALFVPALTPPPESGYSALAAMLAIAGCGGFATLALRAR